MVSSCFFPTNTCVLDSEWDPDFLPALPYIKVFCNNSVKTT